MTRIVLSLPEPISAWAEKEASDRNFDSVAQYVESLLRDEKARHEALDELDRLIQEGEDSGISERAIDDVLAEAKRLAKERYHAKL